MFTIETERPGDVFAREALLDRAMGDERHAKPSAILRAGRLPAEGLALVARADGDVVGTVRLWDVYAGGRPALLLGPLAVDPDRQGDGVGSQLVRRALNRAGAAGHRAVLLVGDAPYYVRFGFDASLTAGLVMPGPVDRARFLGLELAAGSLAGARGPLVPAGRPLPSFVPASAPGIVWEKRAA